METPVMTNRGRQMEFSAIPHTVSTHMLSPMTEVVGYLQSMAGSHEMMPLSHVSVDSCMGLEVSFLLPTIFQGLDSHFPIFL